MSGRRPGPQLLFQVIPKVFSGVEVRAHHRQLNYFLSNLLFMCDQINVFMKLTLCTGALSGKNRFSALRLDYLYYIIVTAATGYKYVLTLTHTNTFLDISP